MALTQKVLPSHARADTLELWGFQYTTVDSEIEDLLDLICNGSTDVNMAFYYTVEDEVIVYAAFSKYGTIMENTVFMLMV